jgi:hypothetical protein
MNLFLHFQGSAFFQSHFENTRGGRSNRAFARPLAVDLLPPRGSEPCFCLAPCSDSDGETTSPASRLAELMRLTDKAAFRAWQHECGELWNRPNGTSPCVVEASQLYRDVSKCGLFVIRERSQTHYGGPYTRRSSNADDCDRCFVVLVTRCAWGVNSATSWPPGFESRRVAAVTSQQWPNQSS